MDIREGVFGGESVPEQAKRRASSLYRLAFLMTGDRARSLDATLEVIDSGDGTDSFFSNWMQAWSQRLVIAKVLAGIREELTASAHRTALLGNEKRAVLQTDRLFDPRTSGTGGQVEKALLAIDLFPRSALLLTVFEGISIEDAAVLLDADRDLVRKVRAIGLQELARGLTMAQGGARSTRRFCGRTKELKHA